MCSLRAQAGVVVGKDPKSGFMGKAEVEEFENSEHLRGTSWNSY
jgi:hypothetical protein